MKERGLRQGTVPSLTPEQRTRLEGIVAGDRDAALRRRAQIMLLADQGLTAGEIATRVGLSKSRVYHWLRQYRERGMEILGAEAMAERRPSVSLATLCERYSVEISHVQHVAALAKQIFEATVSVHGLPSDAWRLLEAAAFVHNIAYELDPPQQHMRGRDIILAQPITGFSDEERRMLACITALHRKDVLPEQEPTFATLKKGRQKETLALTAILRLADALDFSHTQTCSLAAIRLPDEYTLLLAVEGEHADFNAKRLEKMGDLWMALYGMAVYVQTPRLADANVDAPWASLDPSLNLAETGRGLLGHYLAQLEQDVEQSREDTPDSSSLLERDASRLLGVLALTANYFDVTAVAGFRKDVRWLRKLTIEVAVSQLLVSRAEVTLGELGDDDDMDDLRAALEGWQADARKARRKLRKALDGKRYRAFVQELLDFTRKPGKGVFPGTYRKVSVGTQVGLLIWQELAELRAEVGLEVDTASQWQRVRRFHNRLQFFYTLLGTQVVEVLAQLQPLEAQLRTVSLGESVLDLIKFSMAGDRKSAKKKATRRPGVEALAAAQQAYLDAARADLDSLWAAVDAITFRQQLGLAIAAP